MTCVVISQPMLFPWVGMFEQVRLADRFVHYDDVQFSKGSFTNRVQVKTAEEWTWMTAPLARGPLDRKIMDIPFDDTRDWRREHLDLLARSYADASHRDDMLGIVESVYARPDTNIADLAIAGLEQCCDYLDLRPAGGFDRASTLGIDGRSWARVLDIVRHFEGDVYVTGHGAKKYLDHEAFESAGVRVEYIDYEKRPYPQLHGEFNPYVSVLDLIANMGRDGRDLVCSGTVHWSAFNVEA